MNFTDSISRTQSAKLFEEAKDYFPGGVNSPVRAFKSVSGPPLFIKEGEGCRIIDEDNNSFIDFCCSWGPLLHGHNNEQIKDFINQAVVSNFEFLLQFPNQPQFVTAGKNSFLGWLGDRRISFRLEIIFFWFLELGEWNFAALVAIIGGILGFSRESTSWFNLVSFAHPWVLPRVFVSFFDIQHSHFLFFFSLILLCCLQRQVIQSEQNHLSFFHQLLFLIVP